MRNKSKSIISIKFKIITASSSLKRDKDKNSGGNEWKY